MKCVFFSDLHVKASGDEADLLFEKFCSHQVTSECTHVFLLGDMFDLLIGEHKEYFQAYRNFFMNVIKLLESGKKVIYLEGNHDFHIQNNFNNFIETNTKNSTNFQYLKSGDILILNEKKYYYCHGDEVDFTNEAFKKWKKIYTSKKFSFFISHVLSFKILQKLGHKVSNNSKGRGRKTFNHAKNKEKYIGGAKLLIEQKGVAGVICGHTHIQENHTYPNGKTYLNCGHPLTNKNFLYFDGKKFNFINLEES